MTAPQEKPLHPTGLRFSVIILLITVITDQLTKAAAEVFLTHTGEVRFFDGMATFSFIRNYEGFLGIARGLPSHLQFFFLYICVAVLLAVSLFALFFRWPHSSRYALPLSLVIGGGFSNLADRILNDGGVSDFMMLAIGSAHTGIFNLADVYILFGSFIFGYLFFSRSDS